LPFVFYVADYLFSLGKLTSEHVGNTAMQLKSVLEDNVSLSLLVAKPSPQSSFPVLLRWKHENKGSLSIKGASNVRN